MKIICLSDGGVRSVINTNKAGRHFFVLYGNTFPIKDKLGDSGLKFRYFKGTWSKAVDLITTKDRAELQSLGIDCSPLDAPMSDPSQDTTSTQNTDVNQQPTFTPMTPSEQELARMQSGIEEAKNLKGAERVKELLKFISESIERVAKMTDEAAKSDFIKSFMAFQAKFHNYSFHNVMLIWAQKPTASYVAGYAKWLEMGRKVTNWNHAITIFAPMKRNVRYNEDEIAAYDEETLRNAPDKSYTFFGTVDVYDISDTEPIPGWKDPKTGQGPFVPKNWRKDPNERIEEITALVEATIKWATSEGIDFGKEKMSEELGGFAAGGKIRINEAFEGINLFSTAVHECAHEILLWKRDKENRLEKDTSVSRQEAEIDAETTAYIVLKHYGFETADAPNYLVLWKATGEDIKKRRNWISQAVQKIINGIDRVMSSEMVNDEETEKQPVNEQPQVIAPAAFNLRRYLDKIAVRLSK